MRNKGFTLIELLVAMSVMAVLMSLALVSYQASKKAARDSKRKADLEQIRSALEIYRSDCGVYPGSLSNPLVGVSPPCPSTDVYLQEVPQDPLAPARTYYYNYNMTDNTYALCASLENGTGTVTGCGVSGSCGEADCNYKVVNP